MKQNDTNLVEEENELLLVQQDKVPQHWKDLWNIRKKIQHNNDNNKQ